VPDFNSCSRRRDIHGIRLAVGMAYPSVVAAELFFAIGSPAWSSTVWLAPSNGSILARKGRARCVVSCSGSADK